MQNPTADDIEKFARRIEMLLGATYKVEANKEVTNLFGFIKDTFDLVIFQNNQSLVAVEYKSYLYGIAYKMHKECFYDRIHKIGVPYAILYYGKDEEVYFYSKANASIQFLSLNDAIHAIASKTPWGERPLPDEVFTETRFPGVDAESPEFDEFFRIHKAVNELIYEDNLLFDDSTGIVSFTPTTEDKFFHILLNKDEELHPCRYTTINNLFRSFKDQNHCMMSITCMNDKGELTYADKMVGNYIYADSDENVAHNNNCFILSCCKSSKIDDLTMWRLYGDEAKGCCIEYELNSELIDNNRFFFAPVSYGNGQNHHLQLEFVKAFMKFNCHGWKFQFNRWHIWKHFFKSFLFKDEHEYRLLYLAEDPNDKDIQWIRDNTNGIVSRIKTFSCMMPSIFPLSIKGLIIGPKCPEQETLVAQLKYMNQMQQIIKRTARNVVRPSEIKDYR